MNASQTVTTKCVKCQGKGHIRAFQGYAAGVCFDCNGAGSFTETVEKIKRRQKRIEADKRRTHAQMEANLNRMAPLHAIWEQRGDLIAERFPEIPQGAMVSIAQREELWESDLLWKDATDRCQRNARDMGLI